MNGDRATVRVYRSLLCLYPREFRDEYGADMVQLVRDQCGDEPSWQVGARCVLDLAVAMPTQHMEAHMNRPSTHLVPLLYAAVAAAGLLFAIVGGSNITIFVIGLCIAVAAGTIAAVSWKRSGPVGAKLSTDGWWKLVLAGPCIILVLIVAAGFGVEAWEVMMLSLLVAFVATATGVMLGVARLAHRRSRTVST